MIIDELYDEGDLDPKKLFDESQYSTLIINREGFSKKQNSAADLIESLLESDLSREQNEEIFAELKKSKAQKMLVDAISEAQGERQKKIITAACWESGLDFSDHFLFFVTLVCGSGLELAMEAFTVVEEMENKPSEKEGKAALGIIHSQKQPANAMVADLESYLKNLSR